MIKKSGGKFTVFSEKGKRLSKEYASEEEAESRLGQIEHFKNKKKVKKMKKGKKKKSHGVKAQAAALGGGY